MSPELTAHDTAPTASCRTPGAIPPTFARSTVISDDAAVAFAVVFTARVAFAVAGETAEGAAPMRHTNPMSTLTTRLFIVSGPKIVCRADTHIRGLLPQSQAEPRYFYTFSDFSTSST